MLKQEKGKSWGPKNSSEERFAVYAVLIMCLNLFSINTDLYHVEFLLIFMEELISKS